MQGDGIRVVFNDPSDADYVGVLSNISGLDSPDVREAADDLIGDDGGVHGNFYYGRRPIVLEGMIDNRPNPGVDYTFVTNAVLNPLSTEIMADAPDLYWRLNEASGTLGDSSGNGRAGTGTGVTYNQTGLVTGDADPSILLTAANSSSGVQSSYTAWTGTKTFVALVKPSSLSLSASFGTTAGTQHGLRLDTTQILLLINGAAITGGAWTTTLATGTTYHIALKADFAAGSYELFLNGVSLGVKAGASPSTSPNFAFGFANGSITNAFGGNVDEVAIFNSLLSDARIAQQYNASKALATNVTTQVTLDANVVRNKRMTALQRVTNAMRKDLQMRWAPEGGIEQVLYLRRQQPLRISGGFNKSFQAALVAADPRIYGSTINEVRMNPATVTVATNKGTIRTQPVATIYGPTTGTMNTMEIHNHTTGEYLVFAPAYSLGVGQSIVVDFANKTVTRETGTNIYDQIVFASSSWWQVEPGDNTIEFHASGTTTNANMVLRWQDAWV